MPLSTSDKRQMVEQLLLPVLDRLSKKNLDIPMLPQVANQVLLLVNDPRGNASKLTTLIQQDQVLACRVLQLANSAAYGPRYPIETLPQAVSWLGLNFLAGTAFSFSIQSGVFRVHGYEKEVQNLWAYTLAVALYGKAIAARLGHNPDNAFLCGLLHAIGKPFVTHTVNVYQQDSAVTYPWTLVERVIQESYVEAGRQLAVAWSLPDQIKEAITLHEDCSFEKATSPEKGAAITCLARHLANTLFTPDQAEENRLASLPVSHFLDITPKDMACWMNLQESIRVNLKPMLA